MSNELLLGLLYLLLCVCLVYPSVEFVSAGVTIPQLFQFYLGSENESFTRYHVKRTTLTLLVYSCFPLGFCLIQFLINDYKSILQVVLENNLVLMFVMASITLPLFALAEIGFWAKNDYSNHPIALNLAKFCPSHHWRSIASDIDIEFRRIHKVVINSNSITKVVATENWILKVQPLTINVAHQSDSELLVKQADVHELGQNSGETQFLTIEIKSQRQGVSPFNIRINAHDYKDLEDRVGRPIAILPEVVFQKNILDQFVEVFKKLVAENPKYQTNQELELCIGCLQERTNIKLQKLCNDESENDNSCTNCYCRPMWCIDCLAKWFVSRQDSEQPSTWLSSKCTCPLCRSKFCMLDVSYVERATS